MQVQQLDNNLEFPPVSETGPEGLLAVGGDLSPSRLLAAYEHGVFPWYNPGEMIMWWSPPQRAIVPLDGIRIHKSMRNELSKGPHKESGTWDRKLHGENSRVKNCHLSSTPLYRVLASI